ncbi:MAG: carboxypeptidase-like regulatory domain-containing protein [Patiriisocius sp.]|uniref:carboxypeptidase-like regulatory domain-containing protein n=1 Tax=Patiriisocius sp. TaxID=2822396 RepID=UPI003EF8B696
MRNSTFLMLLLFIFCSCGGDDFDVLSDVRLYTSGTVTDSQGTPLPGIDVAIKDGPRSLGSSETNAAGFFEFVAVKSNADFFDVEVNTIENEELTGRLYRSFDTEVLDLSLGTVVLKRAARLNLDIIKSSNTADDLFYSVRYVEPGEGRICYETLTGINPDPNNGFEACEQTVIFDDEIVTNGTASARRNIISLLGEKVIFTYTLGTNNPVIVEIELTNTENNYEFEY